MNFNRLIEKSRDMIELPQSHFKHFSFILRRNRIVSFGWNMAFKTHPLANKFGYKFSTIHSELHAVLNFPGDKEDIKKCHFVNIRLHKNKDVVLSKPCEQCIGLLGWVKPKAVYFSDEKGGFIECSM